MRLNDPTRPSRRELEAEVEELRETLRAIQAGEIDGLVLDNANGNYVFTLEGAEQPYRELVEAMGEGAATLGEDGLILYCNPKFATMTGVPIERVVGSTVHTLFAFAPGADAGVLMDRARSGRSSSGVARTGMTATLTVQFSLTRVVIGDTGGFCVVITDLSDRLAIEAQLRELNEDLEKHVGRRTRDLKAALNDLRRARDEAERANETKSAFLANMSHEIRTPLGAMIGFADLLRRTPVPEADRLRFLETIARNGRALTRIIDDILDLAKVESGKLEAEMIEVSFKDLVTDVTELFAERAREKGIYLRTRIRTDVPDRLVTDPTRVRQILINIVGNAVKFTSAGGVTIGVGATLAGDDVGVRVRVRDTGLGVTNEARERLFNPFVQADGTTTRKYGGTGLGLILSKRLAMALGGDVELGPARRRRGSEFLITFTARRGQAPASLDPRPSAMASPPSVAGLRGVRVLLADDSPDNVELIGHILRQQGALVDEVVNGRDAFARGMRHEYDIILMDVQMPIMDGYAATRALREAGFRKGIIALTAHAMAEEQARSLAAGCSAHVTKPFRTHELVATVRQWLEVLPDAPGAGEPRA